MFLFLLVWNYDIFWQRERERENLSLFKISYIFVKDTSSLELQRGYGLFHLSISLFNSYSIYLFLWNLLN